MCADDVVCTGAEPLIFLDYLAVGRLVPDQVAAIVEGVGEGCRRAGCALLGGETAEHPGVMDPGRFDLAGFCVGLVHEDALLGPHRVREGDAILGLVSSGLHSNGYSLARAALLDAGAYELGDRPRELGGRTLTEELLEPTTIYAPLVLSLARAGLISAAAHVTGGGLPDNVARVLPEGLGADLDPGAWPEPPVYGLIRDAANVAEHEMRATFNLGVGMALVVPEDRVPEVVDRSGASGVPGHVIGRVAGPAGVRYGHPDPG
jgi:phosphoribosylformylglycinamidine cyclo-ligase